VQMACTDVRHFIQPNQWVLRSHANGVHKLYAMCNTHEAMLHAYMGACTSTRGAEKILN